MVERMNRKEQMRGGVNSVLKVLMKGRVDGMCTQSHDIIYYVLMWCMMHTCQSYSCMYTTYALTEEIYRIIYTGWRT